MVEQKSGDLTAEELLAEARGISTRGDQLGGLASRAAALLGRSALEEAIWSRFGQLRDVSGRTMLLVFTAVQRESGPAASLAWGRLSAASHHHVYEMPLTTAELSHLLELVDEVIGTIRLHQQAKSGSMSRRVV